MNGANFEALRRMISLAERAVVEIDSSFDHLENTKEKEEKKMVLEHIEKLKDSLKKLNNNVLDELGKINLAKPLPGKKEKIEEPEKKENLKEKLLLAPKGEKIKGSKKAFNKLPFLEKETIKRLKKGREKVSTEDSEKPNTLSKVANKYFYDFSQKMVKEKGFENLKKDLIKTNLAFTPTTYFALTLFITAISLIISFLVFSFLLFFVVGFESPIIKFTLEDMSLRFLKFFGILIVVPLGTFLFMYAYPSLEKKSLERKIDHEIPFSTIHMSAISQSMLEPSKIFEIILTTGDYPNVGKEFTKLINKINVYGYDLVTSLKSTAENCPSQKLKDLLNGLATTINSGGDLRQFFDKRSQTLLFEHKLEREKDTKSAETFMDVYISVVIAAPMILMLLLMMMKISGLGISLTTSSITLIMVLAVSLLNVAFLTFLHLKKSSS